MLKIVSVNIESDKHLQTVRDFLEKENGDVVCVMEICEKDVSQLLTAYPYREFAANFHLKDGREVGTVLASKTELMKVERFYSDGKGEGPTPLEDMGTHRPISIFADIRNEDRMYRIGATHFTWTPNASVTQEQTEDLKRLIEKIKGEELIMCGDFNIPRGNANYQMLAEIYRDNIPVQIRTTIDPKLHRVNKEVEGKLKVVVDYIWSTPKYAVKKNTDKVGIKRSLWNYS